MRRVGSRGARFVGRQREFASAVKRRHFSAHGFASLDELPREILECVDAWTLRHPGGQKAQATPADALNRELASLLEAGPSLDLRYLADADSVLARLVKAPEVADPALRQDLEVLLDMLVRESAAGAELLPRVMDLHAEEERWADAFGDLEQLIRSGERAADLTIELEHLSCSTAMRGFLLPADLIWLPPPPVPRRPRYRVEAQNGPGTETLVTIRSSCLATVAARCEVLSSIEVT